jgi:hypothetical protein
MGQVFGTGGGERQVLYRTKLEQKSKPVVAKPDQMAGLCE